MENEQRVEPASKEPALPKATVGDVPAMKLESGKILHFRRVYRYGFDGRKLSDEEAGARAADNVLGHAFNQTSIEVLETLSGGESFKIACERIRRVAGRHSPCYKLGLEIKGGYWWEGLTTNASIDDLKEIIKWARLREGPKRGKQHGKKGENTQKQRPKEDRRPTSQPKPAGKQGTKDHPVHVTAAAIAAGPSPPPTAVPAPKQPDAEVVTGI